MKNKFAHTLGTLLLSGVLSLALVLPALAADPVGPTGPVGPTDPAPEKKPVPTAVAAVEISPLEAEVDPEATITLTAFPSLLPKEEDLKEGETWEVPHYEWKSTDPSVVTVAPESAEHPEKCVVTGLKVGKTEVKVTAWGSIGEKRSFTIPVSVSGITLDSSSMKLFVGEEKSLGYVPYGLVVSKKIPVEWESSNISVASVENGKVVAYYPGTAEITARAGKYTAKCSVTVEEDVAEAIEVSLDPTTRRYDFSGLISALNSRALEKTGQSLSHLTNISVPTKQGVCSYGYLSPASPGHGVGGGEIYYVSPATGQMGIRDITFIPDPGFNGTAVINYTGFAGNGLNFNGTIRVKIDEVEDVTLTTGSDTPVSLNPEAFETACKAKLGMPVNYITFDQPRPTQGGLYYNYDVNGEYAQRVDPNTRFYPSSNPTLERVSFVPAKGFSGVVYVPYLCTDSAGNTFRGRLRVNVQTGSATTSGEVSYTVHADKELLLDEDDFNWASRNVTGDRLKSIRFNSLPDRTSGTLYFERGSKKEKLVGTTESYFFDEQPSIGRITFVPTAGFFGQCSIPFTGKNVRGAQFSGVLKIDIPGPGDLTNTDRIYYSLHRDDTVDFDSEDFRNLCWEKTGNRLDYVYFDLPASSYGTLYEDYRNSDRRGSKVSSSTRYTERGSHSIDDITFVASGRHGQIRIHFTGYSIRGERFTGTVEIGSGSGENINIRYYGYGQPIRLRGQDFRDAARASVGGILSTLRFTSLPDPSVGTLYQKPGGGSVIPVQADVRYEDVGGAIDWLYFLPRAGFEGVVTIPYAGVDQQGRSFAGNVEITLSGGYLDTTFNDLSGWEWARPSIEYLKTMGVTQGYRDGSFRPGKPITRGEFTLMLCRAFRFTNNGAPSGFKDVPAGSVYADAVAAARELGIVQGEKGRFRPNAMITRQSAMTMICRALRAAGREPIAASTSVLVHYKDANQISPFARSSVATLVEQGVVQGNKEKRIRPKASISRAEMAVILHRALTL